LHVLDQLLLGEDLAHRRLELIILKDGALEGPVDLGAEELPNGSTVLPR
jgi:hypothetical protein